MGGNRRQTLLSHVLEHSADTLPGKTALVHRDQRLTYAEIDRLAGRLARALRGEGVRKGDRVAVFMENSVESVVAIFGALKAGAAFLPVNPTVKAEKLAFILENSRATALVSHESKAEIVGKAASRHLRAVVMAGQPAVGSSAVPGSIPFEQVAASGADGGDWAGCIDLDLASIIYTSGSTATPKGVMLSHLNMLTAAHAITTYLESTADDIVVNLLPLSFDYGLYQVLMSFMVGGTVVLERSFTYPYQLIETMVRERVTGLPGVPTVFAILLGLKDLGRFDLSSLRYITSTAAALPVAYIRRLREIFPWTRVYSMYGLTECKRVSYLPPEEIDRRPGSVGRGMPNEEVFLVDAQGRELGAGATGELVVRGSNVMMGYWELPDETAASLRPGRYPGESVLHTGDIFRMDEEGYLYFVARKDDIIKTRGEKVSPREVENVLCSLPGVLEAAVVGVPDEILGEAVRAAVVMEAGTTLTERDVLQHCSDHLENFMVPQYLDVISELPRTPNGKIDKAALQLLPATARRTA